MRGRLSIGVVAMGPRVPLRHPNQPSSSPTVLTQQIHTNTQQQTHIINYIIHNNNIRACLKLSYFLKLSSFFLVEPYKRRCEEKEESHPYVSARVRASPLLCVCSSPCVSCVGCAAGARRPTCLGWRPVAQPEPRWLQVERLQIKRDTQRLL